MGYLLGRIGDFGGGLNEKDSPVLIGDTQAAELLNMEFDLTGALVKRNGTAAYNGAAISGATGMDNMVRFTRPGTGGRTLLATVNRAGNNKMYRGDDEAGTFEEVTGGTALGSNLAADMAVFRDMAFVSNGTQTMQYYQSGTTKANCVFSDNDRKGRLLGVCDNRLFVAGDAGEPNTLYFSDDGLFLTGPGTDCSFPDDNFIVVPKQDTGDEITGLAACGNELFIFRRRDIWALMGTCPEDYVFQELNNRVGAVNHRAIANTGDGLVFVGASGIFEYRDGVVTEIGRAVDPTVRRHDFESSRAVYYPRKRQVWISYRDVDADAERTLVFDLTLRAWTRFDFGGNCFCVWDGVGDDGELYFGSARTGKVFRADVGATDDGADIAMLYRTKQFAFGAVEAPKTFRRLFLDVNTPVERGCVDVDVSVDFGKMVESVSGARAAGFNRWGEFVYGQAPFGGGQLQTITTPMRTGMTGKTAQVTLSKTDGNPFALYGMAIQYRARSLRGE